MLLAACLLFGLLAAAPQPGFPDGTSGSEMLTVVPSALPNTQNSSVVLLDLINRERRTAGLKPLEWDSKLADAARDHAEIMSQKGRLSHQFEGEPDLLDRLTRRDVRTDSASENVVYDLSPEGAHEACVQSLPHRANMLNASYDGVGIAVVNLHGIIFVVEDFAHRIADISDEAAAERIGEHFAALRDQFGLRSLELVGEPRVHALVEQMAGRETPDSHAPLGLPGARFAASYATTSLDEIPASVARLASLRGVESYTVSVRFARTPKYPSGLFWVSIVLFDSKAMLARR